MGSGRSIGSDSTILSQHLKGLLLQFQSLPWYCFLLMLCLEFLDRCCISILPFYFACPYSLCVSLHTLFLFMHLRERFLLQIFVVFPYPFYVLYVIVNRVTTSDEKKKLAFWKSTEEMYAIVKHLLCVPVHLCLHIHAHMHPCASNHGNTD